MEAREIIEWIKAQHNPANVAGMARYGINPLNTYGVSVAVLRQQARRIGKDHGLAQQLWASGLREARILAVFVDDPNLVTDDQLERWVAGIDSWDICDGCCGHLFYKTPFAYAKASHWSSRPEEFVKRAGFVLMASLAVHDKKAEDVRFLAFLPLIRQGANDGRNFVKKAVNWALRQIGKRNLTLNRHAIAAAEQMLLFDSPAARWVARDALRELRSQAVQERLAEKARGAPA